MKLKKVFLTIILILLSLTSISCALLTKNPQVSIDKWEQLSDGTLSVDFTVTNKSNEYWNYVEIGFEGDYTNGCCVAYGTVYDLASGVTKTGNATSTYAQGHVITNVKIYSSEVGSN